MTRTFTTAISIFTFTAVMTASNAAANEPANYDYAGLPVAAADLKFSSSRPVASADFAALESVEKNPGCKTIEGRFDYAGLPEITCSTSTPQQEPEWSYLY